MKPRVWLVRHGETDWSASGRHTGRTDVPLSGPGRAQAESLGRELARSGARFSAVYASPLSRARDTATLVGFPDAEPMDDLREWDYGEFGGRTTDEIRRDLHDPAWEIWTAEIRRGEALAALGARADRVRERLLQGEGNILLFAHAHFLRVLAARWMGLDAAAGQHLAYGPGMVSILGYERENRVIERWNAPPPVPAVVSEPGRA